MLNNIAAHVNFICSLVSQVDLIFNFSNNCFHFSNGSFNLCNYCKVLRLSSSFHFSNLCKDSIVGFDALSFNSRNCTFNLSLQSVQFSVQFVKANFNLICSLVIQSGCNFFYKFFSHAGQLSNHRINCSDLFINALNGSVNFVNDSGYFSVRRGSSHRSRNQRINISNQFLTHSLQFSLKSNIFSLNIINNVFYVSNVAVFNSIVVCLFSDCRTILFSKFNQVLSSGFSFFKYLIFSHVAFGVALYHCVEDSIMRSRNGMHTHTVTNLEQSVYHTHCSHRSSAGEVNTQVSTNHFSGINTFFAIVRNLITIVRNKIMRNQVRHETIEGCGKRIHIRNIQQCFKGNFHRIRTCNDSVFNTQVDSDC